MRFSSLPSQTTFEWGKIFGNFLHFREFSHSEVSLLAADVCRRLLHIFSRIKTRNRNENDARKCYQKDRNVFEIHDSIVWCRQSSGNDLCPFQSCTKDTYWWWKTLENRRHPTTHRSKVKGFSGEKHFHFSPTNEQALKAAPNVLKS